MKRTDAQRRAGLHWADTGKAAFDAAEQYGPGPSRRLAKTAAAANREQREARQRKDPAAPTAWRSRGGPTFS